MNAPERIWAKANYGKNNAGYWRDEPIIPNKPKKTGTEYVRADLCDPMQDERVKALVEAVKAMPQDWYDDNCDCKPCEALHAALRDMGEEDD